MQECRDGVDVDVGVAQVVRREAWEEVEMGSAMAVGLGWNEMVRQCPRVLRHHTTVNIESEPTNRHAL
jgi:hypothetical protein